MTAFDRAWDVVKMPFVTEGRRLQSDVLYQGRRSGDENTEHWTPHKSKALAYAMFGARNDWDTPSFVDANTHYPELYMARAPKEVLEIPPDEEYMGDGYHHNITEAIERGRIAYHDPEGLVEPFAEKLPDAHVAQIIENIINSDLYDEETDEWEEQHRGDGDEEPTDAWDRIFMHPKRLGMSWWEGNYPDQRMDDPENHDFYDALEELYDGTPLWDTVTTNQTLVGGSTPHDFVRRLRERGQ